MHVTKPEPNKRYYRFQDLMFWAEEGLIHFIDYRYQQDDPRFYKAETRKNVLERLLALNAEVHHIQHSDERKQHQDMIDHMLRCCREAKQQGDPADPKAVVDLIKANKKAYVLDNPPSKIITA